jgi:hypothetical protein
MVSPMNKTHCPKGHPYEGVNLYVDPTGRRRCRTCIRGATYAWYHSKDKYRQQQARVQRRAAFRLPPLQPPSYDPLFGAWLSGLTDGEGCFVAYTSAYPEGTRLTLRFSVKLRADDGPVLDEIRETLGAGVLRFREPAPERRATHHPTVEWVVQDRGELYRHILPQFDSYPLRSKKARDYTVWREIVILSAGYKRTRGARMMEEVGDRLRPLIDQLRQGRAYRESPAAAEAWNPAEQPEPAGWVRHPQSGRRREGGDPAREEVRP